MENLDPRTDSLLGRVLSQSLRSLNYLVLSMSVLHIMCLLWSAEWTLFFYRQVFMLAAWNYFISLAFLAWVRNMNISWIIYYIKIIYSG